MIQKTKETGAASFNQVQMRKHLSLVIVKKKRTCDASIKWHIFIKNYITITKNSPNLEYFVFV